MYLHAAWGKSSAFVVVNTILCTAAADRDPWLGGHDVPNAALHQTLLVYISRLHVKVTSASDCNTDRVHVGGVIRKGLPDKPHHGANIL